MDLSVRTPFLKKFAVCRPAAVVVPQSAQRKLREEIGLLINAILLIQARARIVLSVMEYL
jgi:hypothetical protein